MWMAVAIVSALVLPLISSTPVDAATRPSARAAASWMAAQVGIDGAVVSPYSGTPSVEWSVNVALGLAVTGTEPDALARAMSYIGANTMAYVNGGSSDVAGRYAWLILLAHAVGADPRSFGAESIDLVAGLRAREGVEVPNVFGVTDDYTPVTNQALAIIALLAAGESEPTDAIQWLLDQQCGVEVPSSTGAWEGYRPGAAGSLPDCGISAPLQLASPEINSTAFALLALAEVQREGSGAFDAAIGVAMDAAVTWMHSTQSTSGAAAGGFGQSLGDEVDPNSTAMGIEAILAVGGSPTDGSWTVGGATPLASLESWQVSSGADLGAIASPWSGGAGDLYATYQAIWALAGVTWPYVVPAYDPPPTTLADDQPIGTDLIPRFTG